MTQRKRKLSEFAALVAMAGMAMPSILGASEATESEPKPLTQQDIDRLRKAQEKRDRKAAKRNKE
jgi:DICT domain-containing protein